MSKLSPEERTVIRSGQVEGWLVQLICWFPPDTGTVVVALFAVDKARLGDVFYDGVAARADPLIDQWKRETAYEEKPHE